MNEVTKSTQVTYYFPAWLAAEIAEVAKEQERSASYVVRNALAEWLAARSPSKGKR